MSAETWTTRLRNALARPHITGVLLVVGFLLFLDAVGSLSKGDWNWYMDYWYNWYVQEAWYVISTTRIWWDAFQFYGKLFGGLLLTIIVPLVIVVLLAYQLLWKMAFPRWYLNGFEEGSIYAWINPAGFWYSAYLLGAKLIHKIAKKEFTPPKREGIVFLYSPNWKITLRVIFNPLGALKTYEGSDKFRKVGRTSSAVYFMGKPSMMAKNMQRRVYTDSDDIKVEYAKGEMDLKGILRSTQAVCGKGIGDALYSNPSVHKKVLDDQGFIVPEPAKEGIIALVRRSLVRKEKPQ